MNLLSFVIPCYRSTQTITSVVDEIVKTVTDNGQYDYEIILVNDCSPDNTFEVLKKLFAKNSRIIAVDLAKNFGQHCALMAGYAMANGDIIISLDDDGQTPANEVFKLIDSLKDGNDVVFASYEHKKHSFFRNFGSKVNDIMACILINKPKEIYLSSYFVAKRYIINEIIKYRNPYPYISGLILRTTKRIANVHVNHRNRLSGQSGYSIIKLFSLWINGFTAFSVKPLRFATLIGALSSVFGMIYGVITIIKKFMYPDIPLGYSAIMTMITFIGGAILLVLGMIGEYVGRTYIGLNSAPQYVIREVISDDKKSFEKQ